MLGLCASAVSQAQATVGRTAGAASVSATGAAQYAVPLAVPPGTNGLAPELAIVYDHRSGNGLLGVGFRLAGFSAIRRCGRTIAQDGAAAAVGLDAQDRLCLDGQRLRLTMGAYGQHGSQYQSEVETFSRVTAYGTAGSGPAWFQVERRDGLVYQYGATNDSRIESQGSTSAREWALNRIRDRSGNYVDFVYTEDAATGSYRPTRVDYTGNATAGSAPYYSIRFTYEGRAAGDHASGYVGGGLVQEAFRLVRIDTQHTSGTVLRSHVLTYDNSGPSSRSRLARLQECAGFACLAPTNFTWARSSAGWVDDVSPGLDAAALSTAIAGDTNGDGFEDLLYYDAGARAWMALPGSGSGLSGSPLNTGLGSDGAPAQALSGDLDGNGRRDIVVPGSGNTWQWLRQGPGTAYSYSTTGVTNVAAAGSTALVDVDGDGMDDFVFARDPGTSISWRRNLTAGGTASFAAEAVLWTASQGTRIAAQPFITAAQRFRSTERAADFNGDGRGDLLLRVQVDGCGGSGSCTPNWSDRLQVFASRGTSLVPQAVFENTADPLLADFNSDGLTDIAWSLSGTSARLQLATGRRGTVDAGFAVRSGGGLPALQPTAKPMVVDWDGDGRSDLLVPGTSEWLVCRSLGTMLETCRSAGMGPVGASGLPVVLDANGDGLTDLVHADSAVRFRAHDAGAPDLLAAAVDGHGVRAEFEYATLTRTDVHTVGRSSVYPVVDYVAPALVVSRLTGPDGVGGTFHLSYTYEGAKVHALGRGFLGFARRSERDSRGGTVTVIDYLQDPAAYEQVGAAAAIALLKSDGTPLGRTTHHWARLAFGSGYEARSFPYVASSVDDRYELDGTLVSSSYVRNHVDSFGTSVYRQSQTQEVNTGLNPGAVHWERVSAASVMNDTANWCIGRVGTTQVTRGHSLPGGEEMTRTSSRTVDPAMCRTTQQIIEPGRTDMQVTTDISYDAFGNVAYRSSTAAGQALRLSSYSWSSSGRFPQSVTNAEGHRTSMSWDLVQGVRTSETDPNGLVTQWQYDAFQRPVREVRPDGTRTEMFRAYCGGSCGAATALHSETSIEQGAGGIPIRNSTVAYDLMDREVSRQAEQPGGTLMRITAYSDLGRLSRQSVPAWCCGPPASWITRTYDLLGRPLRTERPSSGDDPTPVATQWSYAGLSVSQTDALGRVTVSRRDVRGNVVQAVDAGNADTDYDYDAFGNLVRARDYHGNETVMTYDLRGRRASISDVDAGLRRFQYTPFGDLKSETNARGQTATFAYDRISRPMTRQELEGTTTWTWGRSPGARNVGGLQSVASPGFQATYAYDTLGRPASHTVSAFGGSFVTRFSYDATSGRLDAITYPSDSSAAPLRVRHHYDRGRLVRLSDVDDATTTFWQADALDALGLVAAETLGNGVRVDSDRDVVTQRLRARTAGLGGGNSFQDLRFTWDVAGNLSTRQEGNLGVHEVFSYDSRDRLDFMTSSSGALLDLAYDEIGNVTYKSDVGAYVYDATKKHAVVAAGANSYAYDANGSVVNASGTTISWASFDLPTRIVHPSGNYSTFDYGPDRARIRQVARAGGETIETVYAAGGLYERVARNGATSQRHYIVADGRRVAVLTRAAGSAPTTVYLLEDHLGGVDGFTSASGALLSRASNQPFGARRSGNWVDKAPTSAEWKQVQSTTPRGFTDHEHVDNLGVIHMNGRVYDPVLGRFLSPDPLVQAPYDSQTWNRYSYARNNPLRYTDPSGFCFNGHPAGDANAESCFRAIVQNIIVQMSRLPTMDYSSFTNFGGGGAAASDFAAAGSVSGADAAFVTAAPPVDIQPQEEVLVTASRLPEVSFPSVDATLYAPSAGLAAIVSAAAIGVAVLEPTPFGEVVAAATALQGAVVDAPVPVRFGPVTPGPLPQGIADTFRSGSYAETQLRRTTPLYRVYGGRSGKIGSFWTRTPPSGPLQSRIDLALNPAWGNTASQTVRIDVPAGTTVFEGAAAAQGWLVGGGNQVVIPRVDPNWIVP